MNKIAQNKELLWDLNTQYIDSCCGFLTEVFYSLYSFNRLVAKGDISMPVVRTGVEKCLSPFF